MLDDILSFLSQTHPWRGAIQYCSVLTSTNDALKQLAQQGAPHGTVLIAESQTGGRGRLGRSFQSPPNMGVYMSVLLRPQCRPEALMHLTCAAAVAACDAIEKTAGFRPGIKWTNDIVYQKRKLAGILTELGLDSEHNLDYAIIGIGINCRQKEEDFPEEIRGKAGALSMFSDRQINRSAVAAAMIEAFSQMSDAIANKHEMLEKYRKDCITIGQAISVVRMDSTRYGKALGVNDEGGLIVAFEDGSVEAVSSGEVSVRGMYHYV